MRVKKSTEIGGNKVFDFMKLLPAAVAVLGVAIVELKGAGGSPTIGDFLSFAQPIGFGMGYLQLEELVRKKPEAGLPISAIKLIMVTFFSFGMFELFPLLQHEELTLRIPDFMPIISSPLALGGILYTGLITTALALWVESIAFKRVPATDASIILTTEPLFAALAGALTLAPSRLPHVQLPPALPLLPSTGPTLINWLRSNLVKASLLLGAPSLPTRQPRPLLIPFVPSGQSEEASLLL